MLLKYYYPKRLMSLLFPINANQHQFKKRISLLEDVLLISCVVTVRLRNWISKTFIFVYKDFGITFANCAK